jgi:tetratricopeptide (TPR) repeat protein
MFYMLLYPSNGERKFSGHSGKRSDQWGFEFAEAARLLNKAGLYLYVRGRYTDAEPLLPRGAGDLGKGPGAGTPRRGSEPPQPGAALQNPRSIREGRASSPAVAEKSFGPEHPNIATSLNNLAELYRAQGQYEEAEPLYRRALAISEKALEPDHPDVATILNNLALLHQAPRPIREGRAAL